MTNAKRIKKIRARVRRLWHWVRLTPGHTCSFGAGRPPQRCRSHALVLTLHYFSGNLMVGRCADGNIFFSQHANKNWLCRDQPVIRLLCQMVWLSACSCATFRAVRIYALDACTTGICCKIGWPFESLCAGKIPFNHLNDDHLTKHVKGHIWGVVTAPFTKAHKAMVGCIYCRHDVCGT